jgi:hypothetical protein
MAKVFEIVLVLRRANEAFFRRVSRFGHLPEDSEGLRVHLCAGCANQGLHELQWMELTLLAKVIALGRSTVMAALSEESSVNGKSVKIHHAYSPVAGIVRTRVVCREDLGHDGNAVATFLLQLDCCG